MITAASGAGRAEFIGALLNLPTYGLATIGIMGVVDADSGGLTFAVDLRAHRQIESFPGSNRLFSALTLPFWRESVALVERAHGLAFPRFSSLGWDVALTPDKAVLLETNAGWNTRYHQRMNGPLGRSRFSPLVDDMLRQIGC
jgi:hypothetical protein